jgi:hypothetical protein
LSLAGSAGPNGAGGPVRPHVPVRSGAGPTNGPVSEGRLTPGPRAGALTPSASPAPSRTTVAAARTPPVVGERTAPQVRPAFGTARRPGPPAELAPGAAGPGRAPTADPGTSAWVAPPAPGWWAALPPTAASGPVGSWPFGDAARDPERSPATAEAADPDAVWAVSWDAVLLGGDFWADPPGEGFTAFP